MLRITVTEDGLEERWVLQGKLTKSSVAELISIWRASTASSSNKTRIVDLEQVTSIDKSGEEALFIMICDGATVLASGVYTRHLVDELRAQRTRKKVPD
jgi:ABC-type transporter Mla MlaB component